MHVVLGKKGTINDKTVSVLRDTGCSTVVIRRGLVNDDQLTAKNEMCFLIDGMIRHTSVAEIDTPFYKGKVKAVRMENHLYDVSWKCCGSNRQCMK